jgi:Tfp pilus assembly protein PilO
VLDALPSKFDYPALVASLSNLAELTSVNLQSVDGIDLGQEAEQLSSSPTPVEIPITVDIEGSYTAMKKFLAGIENSIRPLDVQSINISGTDSNLRISLAIKTYYQPAFDVQVGKKEVR